MRIGELRRLFSLQEGELSSSSAGATSWREIKTLWGQLSVASEVSPAETTRRVTHHIVVRYDADIRAGQKVVCGDRSFLIRAVSNSDEANEWLKLFVEECVYLSA